MSVPRFFADDFVDAINIYRNNTRFAQIGDIVTLMELPEGPGPYRRMELQGVDRDTLLDFGGKIMVPFFVAMGEAAYFRVDNPPVHRDDEGGIMSLGLTPVETRSFRKFVGGLGRPLWIEMLATPYINAFLILPTEDGETIYEILGNPEGGQMVVYGFSTRLLPGDPPRMAVEDHFGGARKIIDFSMQMGKGLAEAKMSLVAEPESAIMAISAFEYATTRKVALPGRRFEVHLGQNPLVNQLRQAKDMDIPQGDAS